jgi:hypothetical protein
MVRSPVIRMALVLLPLVLAAWQQATLDEVVRALRADGYFVEPGAEQVDTGRLSAAVRDSRADLRPVILADPASDGEEPLAHDILDELGTGTVVVVSPEDLGVATDRADDAAVEAALDRADEQGDSLTDLPGYLRDFDAALAGDAGRRLPVGTIVLVGLVLVGGVLLVRRVSRRRAEAARTERALREAREEVGGQISAVAERIVALHDEVELAGRPEVSQLYATATETYAAAQRRVEATVTTAELERVSDDLDRARWQLEAITAQLEGREPPPEPDAKVACFFDPNHGAGTREVRLDTAAGGRDVRVCAGCAAKLEAGEAPQPRMIQVDGQPMPAAKAPRSYGGGGLDHLDDFTVVVGGRRYPYGWGRTYGYGFPRRRRSWFSGWGWGGPWTGAGAPRRGGWSTGSWSGVGRSRSSTRGSARRSRSISRGGARRSRSVSRGGASRSRGGRRGGGSRRR